MHAITKVMGNVYFCDFASDERKFSHSFSADGAPRPAWGDPVPGAKLAEDAEPGGGPVEPEVA